MRNLLHIPLYSIRLHHYIGINDYFWLVRNDYKNIVFKQITNKLSVGHLLWTYFGALKFNGSLLAKHDFSVSCDYTKLSIDMFVLLVHGKFYVTCHVIYVKICILQTQNLTLDLVTLCSHKFKIFISKLRLNLKYLTRILGLTYMDINFSM